MPEDKKEELEKKKFNFYTVLEDILADRGQEPLNPKEKHNLYTVLGLVDSGEEEEIASALEEVSEEMKGDGVTGD